MLNEAVELAQRSRERLDKGGKEKALELIADAECLFIRLPGRGRPPKKIAR